MKSGNTAVERVCRRAGEVFSYLFFLCMAIIAYEVVARYGFGAPTVWAHDVITILAAVGFVMSGFYTMERRAHIRVTLVYDRLPAPVQRAIDILNGVIVLAFVGLLGAQTAIDAWRSILIMETAGTASQLPLPPIVKSSLALACLAMFVLGAVHFARALRATVRPE